MHLRSIIIGAVRIYFPDATEQIISVPVKSWLRHASERNERNVNKMKNVEHVSEQDDQDDASLSD